MREQVEAYLNLLLTSEKIQDYIEWDEFDTPDYHAKIRHLDLDHEDVVAVNIEFCCRYMVRGFAFLFDLHRRFPYENDDIALSMAEIEMKIWCNVFC